jgi:hypothetical protein
MSVVFDRDNCPGLFFKYPYTNYHRSDNESLRNEKIFLFYDDSFYPVIYNPEINNIAVIITVIFSIR